MWLRSANMDTDKDGSPNHNDGVKEDKDKIAPGACSCGIEDNGNDNDGTPDCTNVDIRT